MADQCEHTGSRGQCNDPRVDGSEFCSKHSDETDRIRRYRISNPELRERFLHHSGSDLFSTLGEELALLQSMVEARIEQATNPAEIISALNAVHKPIVDIVKCAETLSKLERQNNVVLGKEALAKFNRDLISILVGELEHVPDYETIVDSVCKKIAEAFANSRNNES